mgnify:CR=1 FL=1
MNIQLNNKPIEVQHSISIEELINSQTISSKGIAVAVNGSVVSKSEWQNVKIKENDNIIIITATQGG